ncbi:protein of unknown function DUF945 [Solidesulfovibrio carbinoliphilus subsp. oakridgensis]|uniref:DUF945 domain-containing protein n=1 Tax=Solidesulfovibrio carbinoliphilus subsp. oakridgensis TaxID=694327 RepID=G7Q6P0_9BACT|nr:YdgA family protein [Solidesulfovibrio carbinoliphilus]EHJ47975.1 protein of unknown function DUF945 [Solidesulfovibrio carbinoliphilus subsp. oakridgensis]
MKKPLPLLLLLVLVLGLPAAYFWIGLRAERVMEDQRLRLADQYGARVVLQEKDRGIFTGTYRYALTFDAPMPALAGAPAQPITLDLVAVVHHGPVPLTRGGFTPALAVVDTTLAPRDGTPPAAVALLEALPDLRRTTLRTTFGFSGDSRTKLAVPPAKGPVRLADGTVLDVQWQGATGTCDATADAASIDLALSVPLLVVSDKATTMTWQGLSLAGHTTLSGENLYLGDSTLTLTGLRLENAGPAGPSFALTNLEAVASNGRQNDRVDTTLTLRASGLDLKTQAKGGLDAAFSLKSLDAAALDATLGEVRRLNAQPATPEARTRELTALFLRQAGPLFSKNPRLSVDRLALTLPSGTVHASAFVAYAGEGPLPANPLESLGRFSASATARAPRATLVEILAAAGSGNPALAGPAARGQAEAVLEGLVAQGFVVREGDGLFTVADWDGKALVVNGRSLFQLPDRP